MPQALINLGDEENKIIKALSYEWRLSKHETILKIIREYFSLIIDDSDEEGEVIEEEGDEDGSN